MNSAFEQIRLEKITNSTIRKGRRLEELFTEKFSCEGYSQISYRTLIKNYKQFIKRNQIINIDELLNNTLNLKMNHETLRAQSYRGLMDHLETVGLENKRQIGFLCILLSSFVGGERYLR